MCEKIEICLVNIFYPFQKMNQNDSFTLAMHTFVLQIREHINNFISNTSGLLTQHLPHFAKYYIMVHNLLMTICDIVA